MDSSGRRFEEARVISAKTSAETTLFLLRLRVRGRESRGSAIVDP